MTEQVYNSRTETSRDDWETPNDFYFRLDEEFNFAFDLAANSENSKVGDFYLGPGSLFSEDALDDNVTWFDYMGETWRYSWLNPPFNKARDFLAKVKDETARFPLGVVMLLPASVDTKWFHEEVVPFANEIRIVKGRLAFSGQSGNNTGTVVCVFHPKALGIIPQVAHFWDWRNE